MTREERNALWSNSCPHNPTHTQSEGGGLRCGVDKRLAVCHLNDKPLTHPSWGHSTFYCLSLTPNPKVTQPPWSTSLWTPSTEGTVIWIHTVGFGCVGLPQILKKKT